MGANDRKPDQEFFMRISNPNTFRRNLLESSKTTLGVLKDTHHIKQIREQKHKLMEHIKQELREIRTLTKKVDELLPNYSIEELKKQLPAALEKPREMPSKEFPVHVQKEMVKEREILDNRRPEDRPVFEKPIREVSELDKLSNALDEVQKRLNKL